MTKITTALATGKAAEVAHETTTKIRAGLGGTEPAIVLAFASTAQPLAELAPHLAEAFPKAIVLGASTAGEFTEAGDAKSATAVVAVAGDYKVHAGMGTGLKAGCEKAIEAALASVPRSVDGYPFRTAILLLDPLAGNGEEATLIASQLLGSDVRLAGGAAGDDLKMSATHVSCGARAASDAVVVAVIFSKQPLGVGVSHGHRPISRPLKVTRAEGSIVHQIEGRAAWDVWREETRTAAAAQGIDVDGLAKDDEIGYLLRYEAGLSAGTDSYKIRAPLSRDDSGAISFACGIAEGSVIRITESIAERQIESAREAARRAMAQLHAKRAAGAVVFDCICRNLILSKDFERAIRGMSQELGGAPLAGFETYGEIALEAGDMSGFHNTTSVVLAFPEG